MKKPNRRRKPVQRTLDDYLRKPQRDYLSREFTIGHQFGKARWYLRLAPYPLDGDTADAIRGIIDNQVVSWGAMHYYVEEWAYPEFLKHAVSAATKWHRCSNEEAIASIPSLEMLQLYSGGAVPEKEAGTWADDFVDECDMLVSIIKEGLLLDEPSLAGSFVYLPYLPLGSNWLSRVPLLDGAWIDRRIVELCEASAILVDRGFYHLPAADPHSLAWHRFFPPKTRWKSPEPAPHTCFFEALTEAECAVRDIPVRVCETSHRSFIHFDDYLGWAARGVLHALCDPGMTEEGISWDRWNAWFDDNAENGAIDVAGYCMSKLAHKWDVRDGETVRTCATSVDAMDNLDERLRVLDQLYSAALHFENQAPGGFVLTGLQKRILRALDGRALTADRLWPEVNCERRTLYKPGGINELCKLGLVSNDQSIGGYYRPEFPPACVKKTGH